VLKYSHVMWYSSQVSTVSPHIPTAGRHTAGSRLAFSAPLACVPVTLCHPQAPYAPGLSVPTHVHTLFTRS
jgi:hypothetical protein